MLYFFVYKESLWFDLSHVQMLMNALKDWMIVMIMPHVLMLVMATPVPVTLGTQAMEQSVKVSPSYNWL